MDNPPAKSSAIGADGLSVSVVNGLQIASLRYFDRLGSFAGAVSEAVGRPLPEPLRAVEARHRTSDALFVLAWRSPTETLLMGESRVAFATLAQQLADQADGCMVDQTGGVSVIRMRGQRAPELLLRLGAQTAIPRLNGALSSRCAEVHVLTACIQEGEFICFVERVYAAHLLEWIRVTAADF
jgi:heterotetrameric sarcosine oxidase gamma subunit